MDLMDPLDGNHSSEEELEEINKFEVGGATTASSLSSPSPLLPAPPTSNTPAVDAPSTPVVAMELQPVQFSMSPPTGVHVHKPRRSSSPPAKMFLFENGNAAAEENGFHCPGTGGGGAVSRQHYSSFSGGGGGGDHRLADRRERRRTISPRKRYRQGRTQHIQRPCLDFEKMQQVGKLITTANSHMKRV